MTRYIVRARPNPNDVLYRHLFLPQTVSPVGKWEISHLPLENSKIDNTSNAAVPI